MNTETDRRESVVDALLLLLMLAIAVAIRLPLLLTADRMFDSDIAFNALSVRHLLRGDAFFLYYPGQDYQGITEGLVGVLLTRLFGWSAAAYLCSALLAFLGFIVFATLFAREAFGRRVAALTGLLAAISPVGMLWNSLLARGGHVFVLMAGAMMLWLLVRYQKTQRPGWLCTLFFIAGLSYYTYKLAVVAIAPVFLCVVYQWVHVRRTTGRLPRRLMAGCALLLMLGLAPAIAARFLAPPDAPARPIRTAGREEIARNADMLWETTLPSFLGYAAPGSETRPRVPDVFTALVYLGSFAFLLIGVVRREFRELIFLRTGPPSPERALLLMIVSVLLAYLLSNYIVDAASTRYLIPLFAAVPPMVALALDRLAARLRLGACAWVVVALFCAAHLGASLAAYRAASVMAPHGMRILRPELAIHRAIDFMRQQGIRAAYGTYWVAYRMAFLTDEDIVVAPYDARNDRHPPDYRSVVRQSPNPAYLFLAMDVDFRNEFGEWLEQNKVDMDVVFFHDPDCGIYLFYATNGAAPHREF